MNLVSLPVVRLAATALIAVVVLWQKLLVPVLLGLLVFAWAAELADRLGARHGACPPNGTAAIGVVRPPAPRWPAAVAGACVAVLVVLAFVAMITWAVRLGRADDLRVFLLNIEGSLDVLRNALPEALASYIPPDLDGLRRQSFEMLRSQIPRLSQLGGVLVHTLVQGVFAIIVAAMAVASVWRPRAIASEDHYFGRFLRVLDRVVLAQLRIAAFNTTMTALYLFVILPAFGHELPFRGLLCLFTLATGILPVLGNLLANTVLALISFAVSPWLAVSSLVFLVLIHKTEYLINARTVGAHVQVASWEILSAMLIGEALFGVSGLVSAPLLYPFFKREMQRLQAPRS